MERSNKISKIKTICAKHKKPRLTMKGTYFSRKSPYVNARMTLWAVTELGDHVWLETQEGLDCRRIEIKIRKYEEANQNKIGRQIEYTSSGFIRAYRNERRCEEK